MTRVCFQLQAWPGRPSTAVLAADPRTAAWAAEAAGFFVALDQQLERMDPV
jgi:hypothetical protein